MTKIVFNTCYGGFSLSHKAIMRYAELKGTKLFTRTEDGVNIEYWTHPTSTLDEQYFFHRDIPRTDPSLVQVVEELGVEANGPHADLEVGEIPSGSLYRIDEYDGREVVMTPADYEWKVAP